jgi:5-methylcytosine-specific restriction endonuclease McrA
LIYWKLTPYERQNLSELRHTAYAASNQLHQVVPGDVLWIVNVYLGRLLLLGRLQVETVVSDSDVAMELADADPDTWHEADYYAIANRYTLEPMREVDITPYVLDLRFRGAIDRLVGVDAQQLRSLRELMPESASLIEQVWYETQREPTVQDVIEIREDEQAYAEGRTVIRTIKQRQRSRTLVRDAKQQYKAAHGRLFCEVCGFDFGTVYGVEYIEAHHKQAIADYDEDAETVVDDLAMLCANCHRIIHSRTPPLTIEELKNLINHQNE